MTKLFRTLAVAAAAALAATGAARAAEVALFTNTTYVDYIPGNSGAEASNMVDSLELWSHNVSTFTSISSTGLASVLAGKDALVIPELEKNPATSLFNALSSGARAEIVDFVNDGGALVFAYANTRSLELINGLFGYTLATGPTAASYSLSGGSGTVFWGGDPSIPNLSATNTILYTTLPAGSRSIYFSGSGDAVSLIPQGAGSVIFLGWDFFNAPPTGTAAEGGWLSVLNSAVSNGVHPTKAHVALLSSTTYVDYSLGNNGSEASNTQASAISQGHEVMPFDTIDASRFQRVLADRDALAIPEQEAGDLFAAMSAGAKDAVTDFVEGGGNLLVFLSGSPRSNTLVNGLFGFSLVGVGASGPYSLDFSQAAGTPFAGGPASLDGHSATSEVTQASLPPGSRAIYRNGSAVAVASIPVGCGTVTLMGWDWFNAEPVGARDGGWVEVLNRALGQEERQLVANDFNGDTHGDILWRNSINGATVIWLMEDNTVAGAGSLGAIPSPPWVVAGTGDFNRDCKADIMWRNTSTGANFLWQMDGVTIKASGSIGGVPTFWEIAGIRDYNADRASDLLWRNTLTGGNLMWFMDGFTHTSGPLGAVPLNWFVEE